MTAAKSFFSSRKTLLLILPAALLPLPALASTTYSLLEKVPGFESASGSDLAAYLVAIYEFGIWTVGIAALLMAVLGGIMHVTSAGNAASMAKAKGVIRDAVAGVLMALAGWLLLHEINPDLTSVRLPDSSEGISGSWAYNYTSMGSAAAETGSAASGTGSSGSSAGSGSSSAGSSSAGSSSSSSSSSGSGCDAIVSAAKSMKDSGCQYSQAKRNGCNGNPKYTDCSDFVDTAYKSSGCSSPGNYSGTIYNKGSAITDGGSSLKAGDVLALYGNGTNHVVICENDGCKTVIHASGTKTGIKESNGSYYINNGARAVKASDYCSSC